MHLRESVIHKLLTFNGLRLFSRVVETALRPRQLGNSAHREEYPGWAAAVSLASILGCYSSETDGCWLGLITWRIVFETPCGEWSFALFARQLALQKLRSSEARRVLCLILADRTIEGARSVVENHR